MGGETITKNILRRKMSSFRICGIFPAIFLLILPYSAYAEREVTPLEISVEGSFLQGRIKGILQTGCGGKPGTTSDRRPTFEELDIKKVAINDTLVQIAKGSHSIYGEALLTRLSSKAVLSDDLTSQAVFYPAGSAVKANIRLDQYRLGYQRLCKGEVWSFCPAIELIFFDFIYQLKPSGSLFTGRSTDRSYMHGGLRFGLETLWDSGEEFSISTKAMISLPLNLSISSLRVNGEYRLWSKSNHTGVVFLGIAYEWIDFEDHQRVPNHIYAKMGPLLLGGVKVQF